jgi:hypothetical protein
MPTWMATLVIGGLSLVCNLAVTAYYYGRLAQTVADHTKELDASRRDRDDMWRAIYKGQIEAARQARVQNGD